MIPSNRIVDSNDDSDDDSGCDGHNHLDNGTPPGLVGLQNLGNTCYMNGALQALSNCQQLTRFVLDCPGFLKRGKGLSQSYSELIRQIWDSNTNQYAVPTGVIRNIKNIYPAFRGCTQQDTQEFLRCFLEQLHDELKEPVKKSPNTSPSTSDELEPSPSPSASAIDSLEGDQERLIIESLTNGLAENHKEATVTDNDQPLTTKGDNEVSKPNETHSVDSGQDDTDQLSQILSPRDPEVTLSIDRQNSKLERELKATEQYSPPGNPNSNASDNRSIISDTFEFKISSSVVCSSCNNISTIKETFKDLSIPIPSRHHPFYQSSISSVTHNSSTNQPSSTSSSTKSLSTGSLDESSIKVNSPTQLESNGSRTISQVNQESNDFELEDDDGAHLSDTICESKALQKPHAYSLFVTDWFWDWLSYFSGWFWGPKVSLMDCLSIFFGTDPLEGDNEYSCDVCTKKNRGVKFLKILELPEVLCIHFKRYESIGSAKITTHVSFPLKDLDLAPFMSESARPQCTTYNLIACICHHGSALLTGHYTTYALNCYDDQWYEFDDQYVTLVSESQVETCEAYILFYQKASSDDKTNRQRLKASKLLKEGFKSSIMNNIQGSIETREGKTETTYFISKQWVNKFNTFVEPGPITNTDFLCPHKRVPKSKQHLVRDLCYPINENVWKYLRDLHEGGPECKALDVCELCTW